MVDFGGFANDVWMNILELKKNEIKKQFERFFEKRGFDIMSCCCPSCDARMIELVQAIDDLRRSLVIVLQEIHVSGHISTGDDSYYWNHG